VEEGEGVLGGGSLPSRQGNEEGGALGSGGGKRDLAVEITLDQQANAVGPKPAPGSLGGVGALEDLVLHVLRDHLRIVDRNGAELVAGRGRDRDPLPRGGVACRSCAKSEEVTIAVLWSNFTLMTQKNLHFHPTGFSLGDRDHGAGRSNFIVSFADRR